MKTTKTAQGKKRVQPVRRKVRQLDWVMQFITATTPCAICGESLSKGYDKRNPGQSITLHHTEGSREVDDWDNLAYVKKMVLCHKTCHRSYHLTKSHAEAGKNANLSELARMEQNIKKTLKKQGVK